MSSKEDRTMDIADAFFLFYAVGTLLLGLFLIASVTSRDREAEKTLTTPYREPDVEAIAQQRAAQVTQSTTKRRKWWAEFCLGLAISLSLGASFWAGYLRASTEDDEARVVSTFESKSPSEHRPPTRLCRCEKTVVVILAFRTDPLGSSLEPWPHLVLEKVYVINTVTTICR